MGKEIRTVRNKYLPLKNELSMEINYFEGLPKSRWDELNSYLRYTIAYKWAFLGWLTTLTYLQIVKNFNPLYYANKLATAGIFTAILCYWVIYFLNANILEKYVKRPAKIHFENIDEDSNCIESKQSILKKLNKEKLNKVLTVYVFFVVVYGIYRCL